MKKLLLLCMTALFCFACNESKTVTVTVTNPLALERSNEVIEVSMETVTNRLGLADTAQIVVLNVDGQQLPYQITYDGKVIFPERFWETNTIFSFRLNTLNCSEIFF